MILSLITGLLKGLFICLVWLVLVSMTGIAGLLLLWWLDGPHQVGLWAEIKESWLAFKKKGK